MHKFKYQRNVAVGKVLANLLTDRLIESEIGMPDCLVPVPMHRYRLIARGMNPSYELARDIGKGADIPVAVHDLQRRRHTAAQSGLDAKRRRKNLAGAFTWRGTNLRGVNVALVDDVMTTGSTLTECTRVLKQAGAKKVQAWVVARAVTT
jgi:ComF family protein